MNKYPAGQGIFVRNMNSDFFSGKNSVVLEIDGKKIVIEGLDTLFYSIYRSGVSSDELLLERVKEELEKTGSVPADALDEAAARLITIYRENMERAGSINFG
jgi:hypothetical protein